jgi:outer membrane protein
MRTQKVFPVAILLIVFITLHGADISVAQESGAIETFSIQVTALRNQANVDAALKELAAHSIAGKSSLNKRGYTVVYFGEFANDKDARQEAVKLKAQGRIKDFYVISSHSLVPASAQVKKKPAKETPVTAAVEKEPPLKEPSTKETSLKEVSVPETPAKETIAKEPLPAATTIAVSAVQPSTELKEAKSNPEAAGSTTVPPTTVSETLAKTPSAEEVLSKADKKRAKTFTGALAEKMAEETARNALLKKDPPPAAEADPAKAKEPAPMKLTLVDAIFIALKNDVDLRKTYLNREIDRINLQLAERRYYLPTDPALALAMNRTSSYNAPSTGSSAYRTEGMNFSGQVSTELAIPTGGKFGFTWDNASSRADAGQNYNYTSAWKVTFTQPLLKGGGPVNAAYDVKTARIAEENVILNLRSKIAAKIRTTIETFRNYKATERQLVINEMALVRAKSLYDYNKEMIRAGRMAGTEIIQAQADIANQEKSIIEAKSLFDAARMELAQTLYIDNKTTFQAEDESQQMVSPPFPEEALSLAFQHRTDYLTSLNVLEVTKMDLARSKINRLWSLNLTANYTDSGASNTYDNYDVAFSRATTNAAERNWDVGLELVIPLMLMTDDKKAYLVARNNLIAANLDLEKQKREIEILVKNALRNVDSTYRSLLSARQSRELAERKLKIEQEKLSVGRTTNFQLVSFQTDLRTAQISESTAMTTYLNSLTSLDDTLGTTLATWKIEVKKEDDKFTQPDNVKAVSSTKQ